MTTVKQLAKALEDILIKDDILSDEETSYVLKGEIEEEEPANSSDQNLIKLLELVDQYEKLANGKYRLNFINGILNLTRSNYNNRLLLGKKYGPDSYDMRPYSSCKKVVHVGGSFQLEDLWKVQVEQEKKLKLKAKDELAHKSKVLEDHPEGKEGNREKDKKAETSEGKVAVTTGVNKASSSSLKNRKDQVVRNKRTEKSDISETFQSDTSVKEAKLVDPLRQFGGLVPYQLRQSQNYFEDWLSNSIQVLNLQKEISALIKKIEEDSDKTE